MNPPIPPFIAEFTDEEIAATTDAVAQIMRSGQLILGPHTEAFETSMADLAGVRYAVAVNSGSTALEIIFRSLDVRGRTVLVPTNTNFATAAAALYAGAHVRLYDGGLYPDTADIARTLTPDVASVVVVHIGGYLSPDLPAITGLCEQRSVPLIEDAAHAHGSTLHGRAAGGIGWASAFSFYPTKVITCGEGGMITTNDRGLYEAARRYRDQGKSLDGREHIVMGNSWRMTEAGAALGMAQMQSFGRDLDRRRAVIDRYRAALHGPALALPAIDAGSRVSGHKCIAMLAPGINRTALRNAVADAGVQLGRGVYELPLHRQPVFAHLNVARGFWLAHDFADRHICLPLWRHMDDVTVGRVVEAVACGLAATGRG